MEQVITAVACTASGLLQINTRKPRSADKPRDSGWWENGLLNWGECEFKQRLRVTRETIYNFGSYQIRHKKTTNKFRAFSYHT